MLHVEPEPTGPAQADPAHPVAGVEAPESSFVVAIATYRRPVPLGRLLASFEDLAWPSSWRFGGILVIDNDPEGSAEPVVDAYRAGVPWPVRYLREPVPGVVAARNRALREAGEVSHVAMVDDDEVIAPGWPAGLLEVAAATGADVTGGLVVPRPQAEVPQWMLGPALLGREPHPDAALVTRVTAGNILIRRAVASGDDPITFDDRFALSGGEDSYFSAQVRARGGELRWSASAVTFEMVPPERCSLGWLQQRWRRTGATMAMVQVALAADRRRAVLTRLRFAASGAARVAYSFAARGGDDGQRADRRRQRYQGIGQIEGALGRRPVAYGPRGFDTA